jgi:hypothetical protein
MRTALHQPDEERTGEECDFCVSVVCADIPKCPVTLHNVTESAMADNEDAFPVYWHFAFPDDSLQVY